MYNHTVQRPDVKLGLLHIEIAAVVTSGFTGLSNSSGGLIVHFETEPDQATLDTVDAIVAAHDPTALTPDEQAAIEASNYAATLKNLWYPIVTADPAAIEASLISVQTKLTEAQTALVSGDTATGITKMLEAQVVSAQLGQTAMQHILVLTKALREVMRRTAPDILTDPNEL